MFYRKKGLKSLSGKTVVVFVFFFSLTSCQNIGVFSVSSSRKAVLNGDTRYIIKNMSEIAKCPNKLWPGLLLAHKPYIILNKPNNTSAVIRHNNRGKTFYRASRPTEVTEHHLKSSGKISLFAGIRINDERGVIVFVNSEQTDLLKKRAGALRLLLHEAFHIVDQTHSHWKKDFSNLKSRFTEETSLCTPRKYRGHVKYYLEQALKKDLDSKNYRTFLRKAAYWNKKYVKEFPEEFKIANATDISEGSAEFIEIRGYVLAKKGCQATETELLKESVDHYFNTTRYPLLITSPDRESYPIGFLASTLLAQSSFPNWQKAVENGASPVQLLFKDIPPLKSPEISVIQEGCRAFNNEVHFRRFSAKNINGMLESKNYIAFSIPVTEKARGPMTIYGKTGKGLKEGYDYALVNISSYFDTGSSKFNYKNVYELFPENGSNSCGNNQSVFLVPRSSVSSKRDSSLFQIHFSGKRDTIPSDPLHKEGKVKFSLTGYVTVTKKFEQNGRADLWCVK